MSIYHLRILYEPTNVGRTASYEKPVESHTQLADLNPQLSEMIVKLQMQVHFDRLHLHYVIISHHHAHLAVLPSSDSHTSS